MSVLDISTSITKKVEAMPKSSDYIYIGLVLSVLLTLVPVVTRICEVSGPHKLTDIEILPKINNISGCASFYDRICYSWFAGHTNGRGFQRGQRRHCIWWNIFGEAVFVSRTPVAILLNHIAVLYVMRCWKNIQRKVCSHIVTKHSQHRHRIMMML